MFLSNKQAYKNMFLCAKPDMWNAYRFYCCKFEKYEAVLSYFSNSPDLSSELSWSHYNLLMRIEDNKAREFYANESVKGNWSVRQLKRQIGAFYYERLLASQDKDSVKNEIGLPEKVEPKNIIRDPYVLEFLGLVGKTSFYEKRLGTSDNRPFAKIFTRIRKRIFFCSKTTENNF